MWPFGKSKKELKEEEERIRFWKEYHERERVERTEIQAEVRSTTIEFVKVVSGISEELRKRCSEIFSQESVNDYETVARVTESMSEYDDSYYKEYWPMGSRVQEVKDMKKVLGILQKYLIKSEDADKLDPVSPMVKRVKELYKRIRPYD